MHPADRQCALLAILLSVLAILALSACGAPDSRTQAAGAPPTTLEETAAPDATGDPAASNIPAGDADTTATPADPGDPAATAIADIAEPTATAAPFEIDDIDPFTGTIELSDADALSDTGELSATGGLTGTAALSVTHPVALAIADHFGVPADEVFALHQEGLGFGEIARAYFLARELAADDDPTNDLAADQILAMHQGGEGWGQIVRSLGLPQSNRNRNLGAIMSGRKHDQSGDNTTAAPASQPGQDERGSATKDKVKNNGGNGQSGGNHGNSGSSGSKGKDKKSK